MLGGGTLANLWIYIVGPLLGGALAAGVFGLQEHAPAPIPTKPNQVPAGKPA